MEDSEEHYKKEERNTLDELSITDYAIRYVETHHHAEKAIRPPSSFHSIYDSGIWTDWNPRSDHTHKNTASIGNNGNEKQPYE